MTSKTATGSTLSGYDIPSYCMLGKLRIMWKASFASRGLIPNEHVSNFSQHRVTGKQLLLGLTLAWLTLS
jgi:hypothetical protein